MGVAQRYLDHRAVSDRSKAGTGLDSAGLAQLVYQGLGKHVPRSVGGQYDSTYRVTPDAYHPGDLVFFRDTGGGKGITHVGVYVGNGKFIHASEGTHTVIVDSLDSKYNETHLDSVRRPDTVSMQRASAEQSAERVRQRRIGTYENPGWSEGSSAAWRGAKGAAQHVARLAKPGMVIAARALEPLAKATGWDQDGNGVERVRKWQPNWGGDPTSERIAQVGMAPLEMYLLNRGIGLIGGQLAPMGASITTALARQPQVVQTLAGLAKPVISGNLPVVLADGVHTLANGGGVREFGAKLKRDLGPKNVIMNTIIEHGWGRMGERLPGGIKDAISAAKGKVAGMSPGAQVAFSALRGGVENTVKDALPDVLETVVGDHDWRELGRRRLDAAPPAFLVGSIDKARVDVGERPYWEARGIAPGKNQHYRLRSGELVSVKNVKRKGTWGIELDLPGGSKRRMRWDEWRDTDKQIIR